ncbi:MAG: hypothetical protein K8R68_02430, partial [Bacteroidales bacterium]|nr:hypothetical protein [Bacteroidales bacterium]
GPGEFLNENDSTQAYKEVSYVGGIAVNSGSENSVVEGLRVQQNSIQINTSDITIRKNRFYTSALTCKFLSVFYSIKSPINWLA